MEKVTIDMEELLAKGITEVKNPEKDSYVWIDDTGEFWKEGEDAAD